MVAELGNRRFMTVSEVAEVMGISKTLAYAFVRSDECEFNVVTINRRILVPENSFYQWYDSLKDTNNN